MRKRIPSQLSVATTSCTASRASSEVALRLNIARSAAAPACSGHVKNRSEAAQRGASQTRW